MDQFYDQELNEVYNNLEPLVFIDTTVDIIDTMDISYKLNYENFDDNLFYNQIENVNLKNYFIYRLKEKFEKDANKINNLLNIIHNLSRHVQILKHQLKMK